ncbi:exosortase/archaeosortase family protein [Desulfogranum marinum]|uniref:exosortase/archaeosortase family protein n=1 Tax=Desulfogranum marinum TaxID=453220 RepID=UPI0019630F1F|nr:exosortase/archaeosortase family protein [Desulfogranum marinum]MBM9514548.1 exosortase [Desulfogranum marinum]
MIPPATHQEQRNAYGYLCIGLTLLAVVGLYFPVLVELAADWKINDNYSHGFFIPLISAYMIYTVRSDLKSIPVSPVNWGFLVILAGLAQLYIATVGSEFFLQRISIIPVLIGICLFMLGYRITGNVLLPLLYLVFMVPLPAILWNKIAFPLQLFSSAITENVVQMLGLPIFREGNVLHLAQTTLEVIDACSGLRSLNTMFALSIALGWFSGLVVWKRWALFFFSAPIAVFANTVRLVLTAVLAHFYGEKVAQGFLHEFSGLFTFIFGLILLILTSNILLRADKTE